MKAPYLRHGFEEQVEPLLGFHPSHGADHRRAVRKPQLSPHTLSYTVATTKHGRIDGIEQDGDSFPRRAMLHELALDVRRHSNHPWKTRQQSLVGGIVQASLAR